MPDQLEPEMRNPFRNEADAFRVLVMIVAAAAIVIAATVLVGSWLGATLAALAIALGLYTSVGWLRVGLGERSDADLPADEGLRRRPPEGDASTPSEAEPRG